MSDEAKNVYYGGVNEEWFNSGPFDSREEAIAEMRETYGDRGFWIGIRGDYKPFTRDFVDELLELEACDVSDECGPGASDDWPPRIDKAARDEANAKIAAILNELCGECSVFPITHSEHISATKEVQR